MSLLIVVLPQAHQGTFGDTPGAVLDETPAQPTAPALDFMLLAEGEVIEAGRAPATALPTTRDPAQEVVALVPPQALSWHAVVLPPGVNTASPRLRAVLVGLLEDQLLDDPTELHLVVAGDARDSAGPKRWVAACERRWLAMALQDLEAAGCKPTRVLPEWGPPGAARVHLTGTPEQLQMLLSSPHSATMVDFSPEMWAWAMQASDTQPTRLSAEPELLAQAQALLQTEVQAWPRSERWAAATLPRWDLAHGLHKRSRTRRSPLEWLLAPRWRSLRWALLGLLAIHLVGLNALAWYQTMQLASHQDRMRQLLLQTFAQSDAQALADPLLHMQRELLRLRSASTAPAATDLPVMLVAVLSVSPQGRTPQSLDYAPGHLQLNGLALTPAELQALASAMQALSYEARSQGQALSMRAMP